MAHENDEGNLVGDYVGEFRADLEYNPLSGKKPYRVRVWSWRKGSKKHSPSDDDLRLAWWSVDDFGHFASEAWQTWDRERSFKRLRDAVAWRHAALAHGETHRLAKKRHDKFEAQWERLA